MPNKAQQCEATIYPVQEVDRWHEFNARLSPRQKMALLRCLSCVGTCHASGEHRERLIVNNGATSPLNASISCELGGPDGKSHEVYLTSVSSRPCARFISLFSSEPISGQSVLNGTPPAPPSP